MHCFELGPCGIFDYFNEVKFFAFSIKLIKLGVGFLNRTGSEIDY